MPASIENILSQTDHYIVKVLSLIEFIRKPFIEAFIKRGNFFFILCAIELKKNLRNDICEIYLQDDFMHYL